MALKNYGVLVGRPTDRRLGSGQNPHYQIRITDGAEEFRCAVNVLSKLAPSELQYVVKEDFDHDILQQLGELEMGFHKLPPVPGGVALDFIRGNLFKQEEAKILPPNLPGPDNDLNEKLDHFVQRAMADEDALIYAFGEPWGPETVRDKIFGFKPGRGIHDIHQNQGNVGQFVGDDGVWQDGGILLRFPGQHLAGQLQSSQWVAIFLRFQSQAWHTDDLTGHTLGLPGGVMPPPAVIPGGDARPGIFDPNGMARIVAALVNGTQSPEIETVTILNTTPNDIDLAGWSLADRLKRKHLLSGSLPAGETRRIVIGKPAELSNQGGLITLLDELDMKVDGVSYSREQAARPGWTIVF